LHRPRQRQRVCFVKSGSCDAYGHSAGVADGNKQHPCNAIASKKGYIRLSCNARSAIVIQEFEESLSQNTKLTTVKNHMRRKKKCDKKSQIFKQKEAEIPPRGSVWLTAPFHQGRRIGFLSCHPFYVGHNGVRP
jgi:hypothetical protein